MKLETKCQFRPFKINGIAGVEWGCSADSSDAILFLHGWLDNLTSFSPIAPYFQHQGEYRCIAIDFPGHGDSDWRATDSFYYFNEYVMDVWFLLKALKIERLHVVGHSMGALVASVFSSCFPDKVKSLSLIDGVGMLYSKPEETKGMLVRAILQRSSMKVSNKPFKNLEDIYFARQRVSDLALDDIKQLMQRNIKKTPLGYVLKTDPKLKLASPFRYTFEQASSLLQNITADSLVILGSSGYTDMQTRLVKFEHCYASLTKVIVNGGHHCHIDSPEEAFREIMTHITRNGRSNL